MPVYQRYTTGSIKEESRQHTRTLFSSSCLWREAHRMAMCHCIFVDPADGQVSSDKGGKLPPLARPPLTQS